MGIEWPEHREVKNTGRDSDFDIYYPAVAEAMREQGMETFHHLWDRIEWFLEKPGVREKFDDITPYPCNIHSLISKRTNDPRKTIFYENGVLSNMAELVAFVLEKEPKNLFGLPPEKPERRQVIFDSKLVKEIDKGIQHNIGVQQQELELLDELDRVIKTVLTDSQRAAVQQYYGLGGRLPESPFRIAEDRSVVTVRTTLYKAKAALREAGILQQYVRPEKEKPEIEEEMVALECTAPDDCILA